jgi:hypothetical protein
VCVNHASGNPSIPWPKNHIAMETWWSICIVNSYRLDKLGGTWDAYKMSIIVFTWFEGIGFKFFMVSYLPVLIFQQSDRLIGISTTLKGAFYSAALDIQVLLEWNQESCRMVIFGWIPLGPPTVWDETKIFCLWRVCQNQLCGECMKNVGHVGRIECSWWNYSLLR